MWRIVPHVPALPVFALGALLVLVGQWLMCAARRELPLSNFSVVGRISTNKVRRGIYRYLSHPMYVGLVFALTGSSLVFGNKIAFLILLVLVPLLAVRAVIENTDDI